MAKIMLFFGLFSFLLSILSISASPSSQQYTFSLVRGGGCPYTASWLLHVNYFHLLNFKVDLDYMEKIFYGVVYWGTYNFQFFNETLYYVHHMSAYEHQNRKKYGYNYSENITEIYSKRAMNEMCQLNTSSPPSYHPSSIGLIPFYGGRPPNVTDDLQVNTFGEGHSLIKAEIKVTQTAGVICSVLNHFGRVIVGVVRQEDKELLLTMIKTLSPFYRHRIFIKLITNLSRPSNLPFGLVMWAKKYILQHQCHYHFTNHNSTIRHPHSPIHHPHHHHNYHHYNLIRQRKVTDPACSKLFASYPKPTNTSNILLSTLLGTTHEAIKIPDLQQRYHDEIFHQNIDEFIHSSHLYSHIYYTESDQLLFFESPELRNIIINSLNISTHIIGRRREKRGDSSPYEPFQDLYVTRGVCGNTSEIYVLNSTEDYFIRRKESLN